MANEYMFNESESLERDVAKRIINLYPPESAQAAADRIKLLRGESGLAIALTIADFDSQVSEVRHKKGFNLAVFRLQLIGQLGLGVGSAAEFDFDA
jgi:hypothetical protein